jgi:hypothetical protein
MTKTVDLDPRDNDASFTLNLLRILAAEMVCAFHAIALFNVSWLRLPHVPPMQNFGVCIFFVLSGFLIAHTLVRKSEKPAYGFREYAIERIARIYSGWIPALIFVVVVDAALIHAGVYDPQRHFDLKTFVGNFFMFQEYNGLFSNHLSFRMFGSGAPFWTMSVEFHIYLLVGAVFFFLRGGARWWLLLPVILIFSQQPASNLTGTSLFTLWLSGFVAAFYSGEPRRGRFLARVARARPVFGGDLDSHHRREPRSVRPDQLYLGCDVLYRAGCAGAEIALLRRVEEAVESGSVHGRLFIFTVFDPLHGAVCRVEIPDARSFPYGRCDDHRRERRRHPDRAADGDATPQPCPLDEVVVFARPDGR